MTNFAFIPNRAISSKRKAKRLYHLFYPNRTGHIPIVELRSFFYVCKIENDLFSQYKTHERCIEEVVDEITGNGCPTNIH